MRDSPKLAPQERASFSTEDGTEIASRPFLHQPRPVHATVLPDDADAETDAEAEPGIGAAHLPGDFAGPSSPSPRPRSALSPAPLIAPRYTVPSSSAVPTSTATPPPRTSLRSPPLAHRNAGPLPTSSDLETWEAHCRALYFEQSDVAARAIENTLSSCPPAHRATYTRAQSRIRAAYHAAMAQERRDALARLISSTAPHSSLTPGARLNVHGRMARHERRILWNDFVREHCKRGNIGPHPFFAALLLLLEVQARGQAQGGAGAARVEWELDDAVLMEVGGDTFMRAAVAALKGILGFDETSIPASAFASQATLARSDTRNSVRQPRRYSNPFMDPSPSDSPETISPNPGYSPTPPQGGQTQKPTGRPRGQDPTEDESFPRLRIWSLGAHLTDPELRTLARDIPHYVRPRGSDGKISLKSSAAGANSHSHSHSQNPGLGLGDLESGAGGFSRTTSSASFRSRSRTDAGDGGRGVANLPTGRARRGLRPRDRGYKGSILERLSAWLRSIFRA